MTYCRAAIMELENMKLAPVVDAEKIAELKKRVSRIDQYKEIRTAKPILKIPPNVVSRSMGILSIPY